MRTMVMGNHWMEDWKLCEMDLTGEWQSSVLMWKGLPPLRGGKLAVVDPTHPSFFRAIQ